ncbi:MULTISPECIES: helix-turn-helix transcriptional regulator [unclassified Carboxylicivirga]|uniref:helix-turn-helix transcriptional regulator n=1 Tax=Carboxylicivirga TaxID=1628153 RepID=UPI003D326CFD
MAVENIPEIYTDNYTEYKDLFIYDFRVAHNVVKSKVNLSMNMFSFLQEGSKYVHIADATVAVNTHQSLLIPKGNCLWTELLNQDAVYYCKLLFFSGQRLVRFLNNQQVEQQAGLEADSYFIIENDAYMALFLKSLSIFKHPLTQVHKQLLSAKFEELLLYLIAKYGERFIRYLFSMVSSEQSPFKTIVEQHMYSNLKLEEIAFLCNMSLSTFKRHFLMEYNEPPGRWLQDKRLTKAKEVLQQGAVKASDIYEDYGYSNLSNFSSAFKNKFGISPTDIA